MRSATRYAEHLAAVHARGVSHPGPTRGKPARRPPTADRPFTASPENGAKAPAPVTGSNRPVAALRSFRANPATARLG
jgi:hypothetical protein